MSYRLLGIATALAIVSIGVYVFFVDRISPFSFEPFELERAMRTRGIDPTMEEFQKHLAQVPAYLDQHAAEHLFGRALYRIEGIDGLSRCDPLYLRGCFHEIISQHAADVGYLNAEALRSYCSSQETGFKTDNCYHALGHAFVVSDEGDTPLLGALQRCETLTAEKRIAPLCKEGVFMEFDLNTLTANALTRPLNWHDSDAIKTPCNDVGSGDKALCVRRRPIWWEAGLSGDSTEKAREMRNACLLFGDEHSELYGECLSGLALSIFRMTREEGTSLAICEAIAADAYDAELCSAKVREEVRHYIEWRLQ